MEQLAVRRIACWTNNAGLAVESPGPGMALETFSLAEDFLKFKSDKTENHLPDKRETFAEYRLPIGLLMGNCWLIFYSSSNKNKGSLFECF